jgi:hypothetical protein
MSKFNYFREIYVDGYDFVARNSAKFGFISQGIALLNTGDHIIEYSFDRNTLHGTLDPNDPSIGIIFDNRYESKLWLRCRDGYGTARIEAWGG